MYIYLYLLLLLCNKYLCKIIIYIVINLFIFTLQTVHLWHLPCIGFKEQCLHIYP